MDREEPRFNPAELKDVEFRSRRQRAEPAATKQPRSDDGLVWKIAVGVVLGLIVFFGLQRCVDEYRARQVIEQLNKETAAFSAQMQAHDQGQQELLERHAQERAERRQRNEAALLPRENERCVNGKRFRRLQNGWEEIPHQPCR